MCGAPEMVVEMLNLSHQGLSAVSTEFPESYRTSIKTLDASNNEIDDVTFLVHFEHLEHLILDHNVIPATVVFPFLPKVSTLWLNFNKIDNLRPFLNNLLCSFPNLKHLSLMGNEAVPPCKEETFYEYVKYRLFVLSCIKTLTYLDDRQVTQDERDESLRLFSPTPPSTFRISDAIQSAFDKMLSFVDPSTVTGRREQVRSNLI